MPTGSGDGHRTGDSLPLARNRLESALMTLLASHGVGKRGDGDA
jgi:hypothetical protein